MTTIWMIDCEDGVITAPTIEQLIANAETHVRLHHPSLAGWLSRTELLAKAIEIDEQDPRLGGPVQRKEGKG